MSTPEPEIISFPGTATVVVQGKKVKMEELAKFMDESFTALGKAVAEGAFRPAGPGMARYNSEMGTTVDLEVGFPVHERLGASFKVGDVEIVCSELPSGKVATLTHTGGYDGLTAAWARLRERMDDRGYDVETPYWESYDVAPLPGVLEEKVTTGLAAKISRREED